ncbi:MAG TPA: dTDP-4-dehydrorhamnose 3,5-epimerase family protein [Planctomycetota bacterium]|nr:dTDP-4-dehydrorhamnose 3,5-epimerase family protein [Planctomycetota bacterium]
MPNPIIDGCKVKQLKPIADERGHLMELVRRDDPNFIKFGQTYMTTAYPGVVKGWHYHKVQVDNFCCVHGQIKLVLYDDRPNSPTKGVVNEFFLGIRSPISVQVPALVWHGFKCVSVEEAVVINVPTEPYSHASPDEFRKPWNDPGIPYDWDRKNG